MSQAVPMSLDETIKKQQLEQQINELIAQSRQPLNVPEQSNAPMKISQPEAEPDLKDILKEKSRVEERKIKKEKRTHNCEAWLEEIRQKGAGLASIKELLDERTECFRDTLEQLIGMLRTLIDNELSEDDPVILNDKVNKESKLALLRKVGREKHLLTLEDQLKILINIQKDIGAPSVEITEGSTTDELRVKYLDIIDKYFRDHPNDHGDIIDKIQTIVIEHVQTIMLNEYQRLLFASDAVKRGNYTQFFDDMSVYMDLFNAMDKENEKKILSDAIQQNSCSVANKVQQPSLTLPQLFLSRYFGPGFPRNSLLMWMAPGTGKTCAAIAALDAFQQKSWTIIWCLPQNNAEKMKSQLLQDMFRLGCLQTFVKDMHEIKKEINSDQNEEVLYTKGLKDGKFDEELILATLQLFYNEYFELSERTEATDADWQALAQSFFKLYGQSWVNPTLIKKMFYPSNRRGLDFDLLCDTEETGGCVDWADVVIVTPDQLSKLFNVSPIGVPPGSSATREVQTLLFNRLKGTKGAEYKDLLVVLDEAHNWFHEGGLGSEREAMRKRTVANMYRASALQKDFKVMMLSATPIADSTMDGFARMLTFMQPAENQQNYPLTGKVLRMLRKTNFASTFPSPGGSNRYHQERELLRLIMMQVVYIGNDDTRWFQAKDRMGKTISLLPQKNIKQIWDVEQPNVQKVAALSCMKSDPKGSTCLNQVATGANQIKDAKLETRLTFLNPTLGKERQTSRIETNPDKVKFWMDNYGGKIKKLIAELRANRRDTGKQAVYVEDDLSALLLAGALLIDNFSYIPVKLKEDGRFSEYITGNDKTKFGLAGIDYKTIKNYNRDQIAAPWVMVSKQSPQKFTPESWSKYQSNMIDMFNLPESELDILIFTSKMREGVSFKGVHTLHVLTLPTSEDKFEQVIGRAARLCGNASINYEGLDIIVYRSVLDKSSSSQQKPLTLEDEMQRRTGANKQNETMDALEDGVRRTNALNAMVSYVNLVLQTTDFGKNMEEQSKEFEEQKDQIY